jgi:hypothetical protein
MTSVRRAVIPSTATARLETRKKRSFVSTRRANASLKAPE